MGVYDRQPRSLVVRQQREQASLADRPGTDEVRIGQSIDPAARECGSCRGTASDQVKSSWLTIPSASFSERVGERDPEYLGDAECGGRECRERRCRAIGSFVWID